VSRELIILADLRPYSAVINAGGVEASSRLFQSFKQHDNVLAGEYSIHGFQNALSFRLTLMIFALLETDVYGYLGASYNIDLVSAAVQTLSNMLTSLTHANDAVIECVNAVVCTSSIAC
jgi:hypothetical protein